MQVCTSHQTDNHASIPQLKFFTGQMPFLPDSIQLPTSHHFHPSLSPGHLARMDENADVLLFYGLYKCTDLLLLTASQAIFEPPPQNWRRPLGWPCTTWMKNIHDDLSLLDLRINEARDLAQNRPLWRLMSLLSAMHS